MDLCGLADTQFSKEQMEALKSVAPSQFMAKLDKVMADKIADMRLCIGYLSGLEQGWKEGHEHGVMAAQFPEGWPKDQTKALAALPLKQLQSGQIAMRIDVPCIPDYVTIGQKRDIVVFDISGGRYQSESSRGSSTRGQRLLPHLPSHGYEHGQHPCGLNLS